jgi:hypothetical protein
MMPSYACHATAGSMKESHWMPRKLAQPQVAGEMRSPSAHNAPLPMLICG